MELWAEEFGFTRYRERPSENANVFLIGGVSQGCFGLTDRCRSDSAGKGIARRGISHYPHQVCGNQGEKAAEVDPGR